MLPRLFLLAFILFCLELGLFLLLLPWATLWEHNYFLFRYPGLEPWLLNHYVRGAISGLGLVDFGLSFWCIAHFHSLVDTWLAGTRPAPPPRSHESLRRGQTA